MISYQNLDGVKKMEVETSQQEEKETEERISHIRKRILTLEWDKENNQINAGMLKQYEDLKKEFSSLNEKLRGLRAGRED